MVGRMVCILVVTSQVSNATPEATVSASRTEAVSSATLEEECLVGIGERVRWWIESGGYVGDGWDDIEWQFGTGTVVERRADTLIVDVAGAGDSLVAMSWMDADQLEVRRTRNATREGALMGGVAGAILGGFLSLAGQSDPCASGDLDCFEPPEMDFGMKGVMIGGVAGAAIGAVIGSRTRITLWEDVECQVIPRIRGIANPGLELALSF